LDQVSSASLTVQENWFNRFKSPKYHFGVRVFYGLAEGDLTPAACAADIIDGPTIMIVSHAERRDERNAQC
jgi:hypothetical protein